MTQHWYKHNDVAIEIKATNGREIVLYERVRGKWHRLTVLTPAQAHDVRDLLVEVPNDEII